MADSGPVGAGIPVTVVIPPSAVTSVPTTTPGVVTHPRPDLPFTGFDLSTVLVLTALLLCAGVLLLLMGRRPTPHTRRT